MIYGVYYSTETKEIIQKVTELENCICWSYSINYKIKLDNFQGGFLYDSRLPYSENDFYYFSENHQIHVLFSGQIYNKQELNLSTGEENFKKEISNPQLVLQLYNNLGIDFIKGINGEFALFLLDLKRQLAYLIRDHLGIRPLVFHLSNKTLWFSSDGYALCRTIFPEDPLNTEFVKNLLVIYGLQSKPLLPDYVQLPNKNVKKLLPASILQINSKIEATKQIKYWEPELSVPSEEITFNSALKELDILLKDSIKIRCNPQFVASSHLSGGIDSATVASLARKEYSNQNLFYGFSWTPKTKTIEKIEYDEKELILKICEKSNITPFFCDESTTDYLQFLSNNRFLCDLFYEPIIRKTARKNKIDIIFSGYGGDEFISIDKIGIDSDLFFKFQWGAFFKKNSLKYPKAVLKALIFNVMLPAFKLRYFSAKKPIHRFSKYIFPFSAKKQKTINDLYYWKSRKDVHKHWLYDYHLQERMEDWYINGTRDGIEYRYPLLDKRIVEFMFTVPSKLLFRNNHGRLMLRLIGEPYVPKEIIWSDSKNDPLRLNALYKLYDSVCLKLMDQINEFEKNPELKFINFKLLEMDINKFKNNLISGRPYKLFEILLFIKKYNEFTIKYFHK